MKPIPLLTALACILATLLSCNHPPRSATPTPATAPAITATAPAPPAASAKYFELNVKFGNDAEITVPITLGEPFSIEKPGQSGTIYRVSGIVHPPQGDTFRTELVLSQWWSKTNNFLEKGTRLLKLDKTQSTGIPPSVPQHVTLRRRSTSGIS